MTVFVAHAAADEEAADSLARIVERRGHFVEQEQAERIGRALQRQDALVLLWSQAMLFEPGRLVLERRALDAWADGKLVVVALDKTILPVGLRDLPVVDATFEQRRAFTWEDVAAKVRQVTQAGPKVPEPEAAPTATVPKVSAPELSAPPPLRKVSARRAGGGVAALVLLLVIAVGVWQVFGNRTVTIPLGSNRLALPPWGLLAFASFAGLVAAVIATLRHERLRKDEAAPPPLSGEAVPPSSLEEHLSSSAALFVSYAHADSPNVEPVVAAVKHEGREIWMDKGGIAPGEGWAGEIVRAIRAARGVLVMCSGQAFQSDHVKREVYLADRYKKPMLPVFLEPAELPEDFEYFFAGVQWLELHKTPETERAEAIARAVAAV